MAGIVDIVYLVCCGMDIHKDFLVACISTTDERSHTTRQIRRFSTYTGDLRKLAEWLLENHCCDVCMESTGKYWIPVFNVLEKICNVCLTHPKYVKAINCLTVCNLKLDDVCSDVFGKSASRIIEQLIEHGDSNFDFALLIDRRCKATAEDVQVALDGELTLAQTEKLKFIRQHMENLNNLKEAIEKLIHQLASKYQPRLICCLLFRVSANRSQLFVF